MISINSPKNLFRFHPTFLAVAGIVLMASACTVRHATVEPGTIPELVAPSPQAEKYGRTLYTRLHADCELESDHQKLKRLDEIFNQITKAAKVDHLPWHIYLFDDPEIVDIRAVHGNYLFVWTGVLEAVKNDDELASLLACEISHVLAHNTDPVQFTIASDVFFSVVEMATTVGLLMASHGTLIISGQGWMKWAYVEVADLDPLDREYSDEDEQEAIGIALTIMTRTPYSPQALLNFWKRIANDKTLQDKCMRFSRSLPPQERAAMIEAAI